MLLTLVKVTLMLLDVKMDPKQNNTLTSFSGSFTRATIKSLGYVKMYKLSSV